MADSTRDPLSMDTVGSRGGWVASAWPGLGSASFLRTSPLGASLPRVISEETTKSSFPGKPSSRLSCTHQLSLIPALPPTSSTLPAFPVFVHPPHFLLTVYNGGHSLADAGTIMQLRIKQSGLQKTQGSSIQPCTPIRPPQRLDRAQET